MNGSRLSQARSIVGNTTPKRDERTNPTLSVAGFLINQGEGWGREPGLAARLEDVAELRQENQDSDGDEQSTYANGQAGERGDQFRGFRHYTPPRATP